MLLARLTPVQKKNEQGQVHIFKGTYFESFQIYQLTTMYCFEHINYDNLLNFFFFLIFQTLLSRAYSGSVMSCMFR